jgi:proline dehydrogenase
MGLMRSALLAGSGNAWLRERAMRSPLVRRSVARFMPGETADEALEAARDLQDHGAGAILTRLGENLGSLVEADAVAQHYLDLLQRVHDGRFDTQISVKPTQLGLDLDVDLCYRHLQALTDRAAALGNMLWIDMESTPYVDPTLALFRRVREKSPQVGICLQAYLHRTRDDVERLLPLAPAIRVVKGAYREPPSLAFPKKTDVDENFFALANRLVGDEGQRHGARLAVGTHDPRLIGRIQQAIRQAGTPAGTYEFEMLYGIQRGVQAGLRNDGWPLRVLISYGEYWFPWYMRRLAERPANVWFVVRSMVGG